jgi:hypothetical protein
MIDPKNISQMSFDFQTGKMTMTLRKSIVMDGTNRSAVSMSCTYEKFVEYVYKWRKAQVS